MLEVFTKKHRQPLDLDRTARLEVWAAHTVGETTQFIGWCGLLHTELSEEYGSPELQYMIAGAAHGRIRRCGLFAAT